MNNQTLSTKAVTKDTAGIVPTYDARIIDDLFDSFVLNADLDEVDLFPATANPSALRANYEKNPISTSEIIYINRIGFRPNAAVLVVTGTDQASTAAGVAKLLNNFSNATAEISRTGGQCYDEEIPFRNLLACSFSTEYLSTTVAVVHISTAPLVVLPTPFVVPANESIKISVDFGLADGFPAANATIAGLTGGKVYMECHLSGFAIDPAKRVAVAQQIAAQAGNATTKPGVLAAELMAFGDLVP